MTATASRLGQVDGAGANDALFLKLYGGEVLTAFQRANVSLSRHQVRTIQNGKSAQFPVTGKASAFYHTVGSRIDGGTVAHGERVLTIDEMLVSPTFIANIDEAKNHYDVRSIYSKEQGLALSNQMDQHVLQMGVLAARAAGALAEDAGGSQVIATTAGDYSDPDKFAAAVFEAVQKLYEKDATDEYTLYVRPAEYFTLLRSAKAINRDFGGSGSYAKGKVWEIAGAEIVLTNNLPSTLVGAGTVAAGTGDRYAGDFTKTKGLLMAKSAVGTVKLMDLALEAEYQIEYQGNLVVAKYAVGHGILRPEAAVELSEL